MDRWMDGWVDSCWWLRGSGVTLTGLFIFSNKWFMFYGCFESLVRDWPRFTASSTRRENWRCYLCILSLFLIINIYVTCIYVRLQSNSKIPHSNVLSDALTCIEMYSVLHRQLDVSSCHTQVVCLSTCTWFVYIWFLILCQNRRECNTRK